MKIGIVGLGYWGRIILKNLVQLGYKNITVCETATIDWSFIGSKYKVVDNYKDLDCNKVFVLTPATTHFEICKHFLSKGVDVFCEKPLTLSTDTCGKLYDIAEDNKCQLFVDWLFTFNQSVHKIKSLIKEWGSPRSIICNRMNWGPERDDVGARWDLASHDVSILSYLLEETPSDVKWLDFKRDPKSNQKDSVVGIITYKNTVAQINASWKHSLKNRLYTIEFDDRILYWDDSTGSIIYSGESYNELSESPLHVSIKSFMNGHMDKEMTMRVTEILQHES
jgi:predicted dehydrogenase